MQDNREDAFDDVVEKAWHLLGSMDAFVNCFAFKGILQHYVVVCIFHE